MGINFVNPLQPVPTILKTWEYFWILKFSSIKTSNIYFSQCIEFLGLVRSTTFSFSPLKCLYLLYLTLVRSKVQYALIVWNSITSAEANTLERTQQKFQTFCFNRSIPHAHYSNDYALEQFEFRTLRKRRNHLDSQFLFQDYLGSTLSFFLVTLSSSSC
jgi:hypothetical protein